MAKRFDRLVHYGRIENGKLILNNQRWFRGMMQLYEDCRVSILVERQKNSPSAQQWGYLWGIVYDEASRVTGHTPDELHRIMKSLHLKDKSLWRGMEIVTTASASELSSNELAEFITNVILTLNEMGIEIPPPDKLYQFK
jgi:hypothetical protein